VLRTSRFSREHGTLAPALTHWFNAVDSPFIELAASPNDRNHHFALGSDVAVQSKASRSLAANDKPYYACYAFASGIAAFMQKEFSCV
jgi:hypothetical protein